MFFSWLHWFNRTLLRNTHIWWKKGWGYGTMISKKRETLDFSVFPAFLVSNLLLVQRKKYYFNRFTVSRNWSMVL